CLCEGEVGVDSSKGRNKSSIDHSNNHEEQRDVYRINTFDVGYGLCLNVVVECWRASDVYNRALTTDNVRYPYIVPDLWHAIHRVGTVCLEIDNHQHRVVLGRCKLRIDISAGLYSICQHVVITEDLQS